MKLIVVDGNSILNRAFYGIKLLTAKDGTYTNAVYGFMNILLKVTGELAPDCAAVAFDLKAPTFRHKMYSEYKAGRHKTPDELLSQFPIIKELLCDLGYTVVEKEGYEADDILGTLAAASEKSGDECYLITGDRDSLQLVSGATTVRLAATRMGRPETIVYDTAKINEVYGVAPKQLIEVKALMGDTSDNIPGVAGIGEKTALDLIQRYNSVDEIYANFDNLDIKPGVRKKLAEGEQSARMSRTLAEICCEVPISTNVSDYRITSGSPEKAVELLNRLEMFSVIKKLGLTDVKPAVSEAKVETKSVNIELDLTLDGAKKLAGGETELCFLCGFTDGEITSLKLFSDGTIYSVDKDADNFAEILSCILSGSRPKITHDVKPVYRYGIEHSITVNNIKCDTMLAAYLINPLASSYESERLQAEFHVSPYDTGLFPELSDIGALYPLYKELWGQIELYAMVKLLCEIEIPLAKVLASMESIGFHVDTEGIRAFGERLDGDIALLEKDIYALAGTEFNINSPKQLGEVLFVRLELPSGKKTKSGYSTGADVLDKLRGHHEIVDKVLEYRKLAKLKSTYVEGLLKVTRPDGTIHSSFNQTETRTGRISSTEPNLQNIPVRTPLGSEMRRFFVAKPGHLLVDADYSQIELRVLAHMADDKNMISAFLNNEDIHLNTAAQVFDMPPIMVTPLMRSRAKAVNFGIVYGIGAYSLSQDIGVSVQEASGYIKSYLETYSGVKAFMEDSVEFAREHGFAKTLYNRRRPLPEIASSNHNLKAFGERVAMNAPIQGTAADIIKIAMVKVYNRLEAEGMKSRLILQIHDEIIVEAPENEVQKAQAILREEMENAASLKVPLTADAASGADWYTAKG